MKKHAQAHLRIKVFEVFQCPASYGTAIKVMYQEITPFVLNYRLICLFFQVHGFYYESRQQTQYLSTCLAIYNLKRREQLTRQQLSCLNPQVLLVKYLAYKKLQKQELLLHLRKYCQLNFIMIYDYSCHETRMLLPVFLQVNIRIIIQELNKQKNQKSDQGFTAPAS